MNILHIIFSLNIGGAESLLVDIANEQSNNENKIGVLVINDILDSNLMSKLTSNISIIRIDRKPSSRKFYDILKLNFRVALFKPDIIHCHNSSIIKLLFYPFAKIVLTIHAMNIDSKFFSRYDKLFAISEIVKQDVLNKRDFNISVVSNGIHVDKIIPKEDYNQNVFKIINVGRFEDDLKGQDILIKAVSQLYNKYKLDVELSFIGDGDSLERMKKLSFDEKIDFKVNFLGLQNRDFIYNNLHKYDLYVQPSRFEGFGLTVIEAMAARVPVLVSDNTGSSEIIENGKYGYSFTNGNAEDCALKIIQIYEDLINSTEKSNAAYLKVNSSYSVNNMVKKYLIEYSLL